MPLYDADCTDDVLLMRAGCVCELKLELDETF